MTTSITQINNSFEGLNLNFFLNSTKKISREKVTGPIAQPQPQTKTLDLEGFGYEYTITIDNRNDKIIVSKRSNNGFGVNPTEKPQEYKLSDYDVVGFKQGTSQAITLEDYKKENKPVSISYTQEGYSVKNLYRSAQGRKDIVKAGDNSDQFRASKKMDGDIFIGGGGVDTLYLQGKEEDYTYEYVDLGGYGRVLKITDKNDANNFMYIGTDVERIRYVKGPAKRVSGRKIELTPEQRRAEFKKIDQLTTTGIKTFDVDDLLGGDSESVFGSQSDDVFTWNGQFTGTLKARAGSDTLILKGSNDNQDYTFSFNYDENNKFSNLEIALGDFGSGTILKCYDLEKITLPSGKTVTLKELEAMLGEDGKIKSSNT